MNNASRLKLIPAAVIALIGGMQGVHAGMIAGVCHANGTNICQSPDSKLTTSPILTIRGYAFDLATGDRPVAGGGGYVLLRNEDTLANYKLPIQRVEARPDVVGQALTEEITPEQYQVVNAGFIAQVFMASLPPGRYSVQEARVSMKQSGLVKLPLDNASARGTFTLVGDGQSAFQLVAPDGTLVPIGMGRSVGGIVPATGYPPLRDGSYKIQANLAGVTGGINQSVDFVYRRPVLNAPVSMPIVEGFPGLATRLAPVNPLTNRALDAAKLPVVVEDVQGGDVTLNGEKLIAGKALDILRMASVSGLYSIQINDNGDTEQQQTTKLWVALPDAPNINITSTRWNPAKKIKVGASKSAVAIKVEDLDIQAKLEGGSPDTCQNLTTVRPEYMLSQTAGVACAIKYGDLLDGMKYNPYAPNALRGSVPSVGTNTIPFTPGVVYTDPSSKKTAFYPAKGGEGVVSIEGAEPQAIELAFKHDKALDALYTKNAGQYPGRKFAIVDRAQARSMGVMNVKGAHREIVTRITYPGVDNVKEVYSSIPENNVALIYQADEPWQGYPVKVESWYHRAPEFKTEQILDFIGIPMSPLVELEKTFASHDQAETIIHGQVGVSKGQVLQFDPAAMGTWQVVIREEKGTTPLSAPVTVASDGTFSVNLGRLSAGTRYIVAEAKMLDGSGTASNSSVVSKSRALITAVGNMIEASLSVRSQSGRVPFAQTINTNLKNTKLLSSLKAVSWERQKEDGSWERIMRNETTEQTGVNYTATVATAGKAAYRAVLVNKYSGAEFVTDPITLHAFDVPSFSVSAPGVVQVKRPVTLEVQADEGFSAEYTWRLITAGGYEGVSETTGNTFTFTPTEMKNYVLEVVGRSVDAPDNPMANVTKTIGLKAVNPLAARASISGPTYLEAGKSYTFKATINDVVPTTSTKAYDVKGYWQLPDGTRVDGTELVFTPRAGDSTLSYFTYVDGYPDETTVSVQTFKTWSYVWPTNWRIKLTPIALDVPASIKYYVEAPDFDLKSLNGEPLTYTWALPQDVSRSSGSDVAGTLAVTRNGTYQVAVQVADTRGNIVNVTSDEFTILPPSSVKTQASIVSKYGAMYYAPGTYYISLKITEMPRGDSFLRNEVLINNNKVGEFTGSGNYVSFADPGNYEVMVRTITKAGNYGEQLLNVTVAPPPEPICELKQSTTTSGILISPVCTVPVGYIKALTWTYKIDGVEQRTTSKSFLVTKDWIANSRISGLTLLIETDLGSKKTESIVLN